MIKKQRFDVFFQQINRQIITVDAETPDKAAEKAERIYRRGGYGSPVVDAVQTAEASPKTPKS